MLCLSVSQSVCRTGTATGEESKFAVSRPTAGRVITVPLTIRDRRSLRCCSQSCKSGGNGGNFGFRIRNHISRLKLLHGQTDDVVVLSKTKFFPQPEQEMQFENDRTITAGQTYLEVELIYGHITL